MMYHVMSCDVMATTENLQCSVEAVVESETVRGGHIAYLIPALFSSHGGMVGVCVGGGVCVRERECECCVCVCDSGDV